MNIHQIMAECDCQHQNMCLIAECCLAETTVNKDIFKDIFRPKSFRERLIFLKEDIKFYFEIKLFKFCCMFAPWAIDKIWGRDEE